MECSRCGRWNSEFSAFNVAVDVTEETVIEGNRIVSWLNKVVGTKIAVPIKVCQSCQSYMFRRLDKKK